MAADPEVPAGPWPWQWPAAPALAPPGNMAWPGWQQQVPWNADAAWHCAQVPYYPWQPEAPVGYPPHPGYFRSAGGTTYAQPNVSKSRLWLDGDQAPQGQGRRVKTRPTRRGGEAASSKALPAVDELTDTDPGEVVRNKFLAGLVYERALGSEALLDDFVGWLLPVIRELSLDAQGSRIVQRLLDVDDATLRSALLDRIVPHAMDMMAHPCGNYVLNKAIEVMPGSEMYLVVEKVLEADVMLVAKHRYGCRIAERLMECCTPDVIRPLADALLESALELTNHEFGNFVVKSLLDHGTMQDTAALAAKLTPHAPRLVLKRSGSFIMQHMLLHCSEADQAAIAAALVRTTDPPFLDLVVDRSGSYVIEELSRLRGPAAAGLIQEARVLLARAEEQELDQASKALFKRVQVTFGLKPPEC